MADVKWTSAEVAAAGFTSVSAKVFDHVQVPLWR
jgi:hypothetical protein